MSTYIKKNISKILIILVVIGRLAYAFNSQSRAWIDEVWVMMEPAFFKVTGFGYLNRDDWGSPPYGIRSWIPPLILSSWLKMLHAITRFWSTHNGVLVIGLVRVSIGLLSVWAVWAYVRLLAKAWKIEHRLWWPLLALLASPMLILYNGFLELSVIAIPIYILSLFLLFGDGALAHGKRFMLGCAVLTFSALVRFHFLLFLVGFFLYLARHRHWRKLGVFVGVGFAVLAIDTLINSMAFGRFNLPLVYYFLGNFFYGLADGSGVVPFFVGFEYLFKFTTEPGFLGCIVVFVLGCWQYRRLPDVVQYSLWSLGLITAVHFGLGHKELRYFYPLGFLWLGLVTVAAEYTFSKNKTYKKIYILFYCLLFSFSVWRGAAKTSWHQFEQPGKLSTWAGSNVSDLQGLIIVGWHGVYNGGHYSLHRPIPMVFMTALKDLKTAGLDATRFNYVIAPVSSPDFLRPPCAEQVRVEAEAALYRCTMDEVRALVGG